MASTRQEVITGPTVQVFETDDLGDMYFDTEGNLRWMEGLYTPDLNDDEILVPADEVSEFVEFLQENRP